jgi:K+-transporting ATPase ATPase B chain
MSERARTLSIWDSGIVLQAVVDSFRKLDPRLQAKNPVMFIVEVGSLLTTVIFIQELAMGGGRPLFTGQVVLAVVHRPLRQFRRGDGRRAR